jgi:hypothetical protein
MADAEKPTYRAFVMDRDSHIRAAKIIEAEDDETAIKAVRPMVDGHAIEIWERKRFIVRLEPGEPKQTLPE